MNDDLRAAIIATAGRIGANPHDLATVMSYETSGTFDPWKRGPTTQWGQHRGLIQWGEPQRQQYGVYEGMPVGDQVGAAGRYLQDAGFKPGMGLLDMYSAVNAGRVGRYGASDAGNGGAPGTVADKVGGQMDGHRAKASALLGGEFAPSAIPGPVEAPAGAAKTLPGEAPAASGRFGFAGIEPSATSAPAMTMPETAPAAGKDLDYNTILSSLLGAGQKPEAATRAAPAPQPLVQAPQPRPVPFDLSGFLARLKAR